MPFSNAGSSEYMDILNLQALRVVTDGDAEFEQEMLDLFLQTAEPCMNSLHALALNANQEEWFETLHALKGAAANIHADHLVACCQEGEAAETAAMRIQACKKILQAYGELKPFLLR